MSKLKIEYINIDKLIPYINNPRINDNAVDKVAGSIKEFGFKNPIIIDSENVIIAGHTRLLASRKLNLEEVPIIRAEDLTDKQIKAFRIADNKTSEFAEWDMELLEIEMDGLEDIFTGFDEVEFDDIMGIEPEIIEDDFDIEPPVNPISKRGDIWLLGEHRLLCGDSVSSDVEVLMNGEQADLVVTDPPYNVAVNDESEESLIARNRRVDGLKVQNDNMSDGDFKIFLEKVFIKYNNLLKEGCPIYVFYADSETINFMSSFADAGFHFAQNCIWNKQQFVMTRKDYHYKHEPILYGWKKGAAHPWHTDRKQSSVWDFDRPFRSELHPTTKPLDLIAYPINNSSKKKELVVDLFGGSGSTLIACEQLDRICYMMELDEKYVDVIVNRYIAFKEDIHDDVYLIRDGVKTPYRDIVVV